MEEIIFHHALKVQEETCIGCANCMGVCPTEAIRVKHGKARIYNNKCIDCGQCYRVCPVSAIYVEEDDFSNIFSFSCRVALMPAVLTGQFPEEIKIETIYQTLYDLGFTHVYEIENCVDLLSDELNRYLDDHREQHPQISAFCPAVVRLIQVNFPSLVENLVLLKPPLDIAAEYYRKKLLNEGFREEEIGLFYVTPCAAKIAAVKSPVGETQSPFNGVINMNSVYNRLYKRIKKGKTGNHKIADHSQLTDREMLWSLTHGEASATGKRSLAIDGIHNVIEFLEKIESGEIKGIDFLEMRACDESCAGGILTSGNKFLTVERLRNRAATSRKSSDAVPSARDIDNYRNYLIRHIQLDKVDPRSSVQLDQDLSVAMGKMKKQRHIMCFLPGFDCGGCGAPTCQALAEDVVQGDANISHCVFLQKIMEKNHKLSPEHALDIIEEIWGRDRLDKNCKKKGADHESI
ncbi:MAG TPA: [Fe-Fe] hydrogenase large subunit C-terminal domain-containing protein [Bacteroidales bacterium]|nr:[Fe-Fe] hydrogenase large subunit C-terminal domain-containing protein [Bacteroidales bacterium]